MIIHFFIAGLENKYSLGKSERPRAHELMSQTGGELMSWSPSVSAALAQIPSSRVVKQFLALQIKAVHSNNRAIIVI